MLALWRGSAFADDDGYDAWERRVNERLAEAIESGELGCSLSRASTRCTGVS